MRSPNYEKVKCFTCGTEFEIITPTDDPPMCDDCALDSRIEYPQTDKEKVAVKPKNGDIVQFKNREELEVSIRENGDFCIFNHADIFEMAGKRIMVHDISPNSRPWSCKIGGGICYFWPSWFFVDKEK